MGKGIIVNFRNIFIALLFILVNITVSYASDSATTNMSFTLQEYVNIQTLTSPVLTAHITDKTGNLHLPLFTKFRVITNCSKPKTLYLKSEAITDGGVEDSMFERGGRVYVAFTYVNKRPGLNAISACKAGGLPKDSPGVVAYPITSITGTKSEYSNGINRYKVHVNNGITDISVNLGTQVLRESFDRNDPRGFYQATLSLTESEI